MRTEILFKDLNRSEYVEAFVEEKIDGITHRWVSPNNDTHVSVRISRSKERTEQRQPIYQCEIILKSGMSSKTYKTVKSDRNIFKSVTHSFESMRTMLGKTHDRLRHDRRRRRVPEVLAPRDFEPESLELGWNEPFTPR
jgi:ribosome-associated translation inhibitor RaiA